jgi:hypothetical protein
MQLTRMVAHFSLSHFLTFSLSHLFLRQPCGAKRGGKAFGVGFGKSANLVAV